MGGYHITITQLSHGVMWAMAKLSNVMQCCMLFSGDPLNVENQKHVTVKEWFYPVCTLTITILKVQCFGYYFSTCNSII